MAERQVLAEATVQSQAEARITDEKIKTWYDEHLVHSRVSEADLAMIMVSSEEDAKAIKAELMVVVILQPSPKKKVKIPERKTKVKWEQWISNRCLLQ